MRRSPPALLSPASGLLPPERASLAHATWASAGAPTGTGSAGVVTSTSRGQGYQATAGGDVRPELREFDEVAAVEQLPEVGDHPAEGTRPAQPVQHPAGRHLHRLDPEPALRVDPYDVGDADVIGLHLAQLQQSGRFERVQRLEGDLVRRPGRDDRRRDLRPLPAPVPPVDCRAQYCQAGQPRQPWQQRHHAERDRERALDVADVAALVTPDALHSHHRGIGRQPDGVAGGIDHLDLEGRQGQLAELECRQGQLGGRPHPVPHGHRLERPHVDQLETGRARPRRATPPGRPGHGSPSPRAGPGRRR